MINLVSSTMMSLIKFTILVILGVATSQNHELKQRNVEAKAPLLPPSARAENAGIEYQLIRLEVLLVEKLENLRTEVQDINTRLQSLEYQSVRNISNEPSPTFPCFSGPATPVLQNTENLEAKVENLDKDIQVLMDSTKILSSDGEAVKRNFSSLINVTSSLMDSSSNLVSKKVFDEGLQELKDLQRATVTSCSLNFTLDKQYPKNCKEVPESLKKASRIYTIQPDRAVKPFQAVCDFETRGGDWTVIQRRFDGSEDFYLGWEDYQNGFGNLEGEFWFGLENIHLLTGYEINELLIELGDFELNNKTAFYSRFSIGSEIEGYALQILGGYMGDAGDSLSPHIGCKFTTKDLDQDYWLEGNCAHRSKGAWWYNNCYDSNLNGKYFGRGEVPESEKMVVTWDDFDYMYKILKHARMLVRPKV